MFFCKPPHRFILSISMKNVVLNVNDDDIMIIGFFKETLQKYKIDSRIESTFLIDSATVYESSRCFDLPLDFFAMTYKMCCQLMATLVDFVFNVIFLFK